MQECKRRIGDSVYYACDMYDAVLDADALMLVTEFESSFSSSEKYEFLLPVHAIRKIAINDIATYFIICLNFVVKILLLSYLPIHE